ncbi:MAG TPA: glycosyltransferase family 39 protein, partial [bacterium]|nr:glycosyltransferase family 39 protein [bacterium]
LIVTGDRSFYEQHLAEMDKIYLAARSVAAVQGALTVPLLALLGARYYAAGTGLLAALLLAVTPLHTYNSHFGYVVAPTLFWALLAWLVIARVQLTPRLRRRDLFVAGLLITLATLVQYVALLLVPLVAVAVAVRWRDPATPLPRTRRWWLTALAALGAGLVLGTLVGCPNAWFDFPGFLKHFGFYFTDRLSGAQKAAYNLYEPALQFYLLKAPYENFGVVLAAVMLVGGMLAVLRRTGSDCALLAFFVINLLLLAKLRWYMAHYLIMVMPAMLLLAARLLAEIRRPLLRGLTVTVVAGMTLAPTLAYNARLAAPDTRTEASRWLEANLPAGASIGVNDIYFYSVPAIQQLSGSPFRVVRCQFSTDTLVRAAPDYFLVSDYEFGMAGAVLRDEYQPALHMAAFYREVFRRYRAVREFYRPLVWAEIDWTPYNKLLAPYPRLRFP